MKGLLIKDAILIKKYCLFHFFVSILFFAISVFGQENLFFGYYAVTMISIIPITISAYDEQTKWNSYEAILPVGRKNIAAEKHLITLCLVLPVTLIYSAVLYFTKEESLNTFLLNAAMMLLFGIISPCIILPIISRFGYLKGRIINFIIIAILVVIASISASASGIIESTGGIKLTAGVLAAILAAAAVLIFIASLLISAAIYSKKEF